MILGIDWGEVAGRLGISGTHAVAVVLSAVGIYLVFLVLVRVFGPRVLHGMGTFDVVVTITIGAVAGRVILGHPPTLAAGAIGLLCLFVMEALVGEARRTLRGARLVNAGPVVLMAGRAVLSRNLKAAHVTEVELRAALRHAGIRHHGEVLCVVFESTGRMSVLKRGETVDPDLLTGVRDAERIPRELLSGGG